MTTTSYHEFKFFFCQPIKITLNYKQSPHSLPAKMLSTNIIEDLDISQYLVLKKDGEDGPEVKGGYPDALIVHASKMQKVSENGKWLFKYNSAKCPKNVLHSYA